MSVRGVRPIRRAAAVADLSEQLRSKIRVDSDSGCWVWTAALNAYGYGHVTVQGKTHRSMRLIYKQLAGPIPEGLHLDHLCRNRACVNPDHMEPVTPWENTLRGDSPWAAKAKATHCKRGHAFDEANTYVSKNGTRSCRECHRVAENRRNQRKRAERAA